MSIILSIETATNVCSVSIQKDDELIGLKELFTDKSHSGLLPVLIRDLLNQCGYSVNDLNAVAVSKGPGSYTGLRIGTSAAKGLCYALQIPLISVNTLKAMAHGMVKYNINEYLLCPMLDARRMEVYCLLTDNVSTMYVDTQALVMDSDTFSNLISDRDVLVFGPGSEKLKQIEPKPPKVVFIDQIRPSAVQIGQLAYQKFQQGVFEDLAYFEPFYLKEFITRKPKAKF